MSTHLSAFVLRIVGGECLKGTYCIGMCILYTWTCVVDDLVCVCIAERGGELMSRCECEECRLQGIQ